LFFKIYIVWPTLIDNEEIKNGGMLAVIKSNNLAINYLNVKLAISLRKLYGFVSKDTKKSNKTCRASSFSYYPFFFSFFILLFSPSPFVQLICQHMC
jgi:hypothetical protein